MTQLENRPAETRSQFSYLAAGINGDLYTYFRQRSEYGDPAAGLIEIDYFSPLAVRLNKSPIEISSTYYNQRVYVFNYPNQMSVSLAGNLFYTITLDNGFPPGDPNHAIMYSLVWYNPMNGVFKTLTTVPFEAVSSGLSLTLDLAGNLFYTDGSSLFRISD